MMKDVIRKRLVQAAIAISMGGAGVATYQATHPVSLQDISWMLPKASYGQPTVTAGRGTVRGDSVTWIVTAQSGTSIAFKAAELAGPR